jgi:hypothetical protein
LKGNALRRASRLFEWDDDRFFFDRTDIAHEMPLGPGKATVVRAPSRPRSVASRSCVSRLRTSQRVLGQQGGPVDGRRCSCLVRDARQAQRRAWLRARRSAHTTDVTVSGRTNSAVTSVSHMAQASTRTITQRAVTAAAAATRSAEVPGSE